MTRIINANEVARGLRFKSEIKKDIRLPRYPGWLLVVMRLRYYVPALVAWLSVGAIFGAGPLWWAVLMAIFVLHWAAHRAVRRKAYHGELGKLREICGTGRAPIESYYRREREEAPIVNPVPDRERSFGDHLVSETDPIHQMRKIHARRILKELVRPNARSADVGCLAGDISEEHIQAGCTAFLFDLDLESLHLAQSRTGRPAARADVGRFPSRPGAFDFISLFEVIEHVADPMAAIRELADALAPGGRMVLSTDNAGFLLGVHLLNPLILLERIAGLYLPSLLPPRNLVKTDLPMGKEYPHVSFTSAHIRSLIGEAGLKIIWMKSYYFLPGMHRPAARLFPSWTDADYARFALPLEFALQKIPIISCLGTHWVVACEKPKEKSKISPGSGP
ncbi:MAG: class I SAM-dependent methyltransferase [Nitrospinaceae bacterium]|jgi:2-polyprenyl-3-methyl-5-hydroxy-6-metoxy-1,4-benzoquinol methylase|nr:class I SAM-dependent methyltransferase [Nitrospinaceae bacterium]MBT3434815.1 class I SAM-dependent methyltransferase [Nitrospinaceae bacterium]MBT3821180.1 class I SAM-dependent methyltransferase [Nitrospinaceae bacterium]MBT4095505.1 class I SAM-dependent methyltransferase [Nitrospinaceae bacterium]MBT4429976.1 class I SAM-dependent methyltransferase [Nitrospinaceae bacterium]